MLPLTVLAYFFKCSFLPNASFPCRLSSLWFYLFLHSGVGNALRFWKALCLASLLKLHHPHCKHFLALLLLSFTICCHRKAFNFEIVRHLSFQCELRSLSIFFMLFPFRFVCVCEILCVTIGFNCYFETVKVHNFLVFPESRHSYSKLKCFISRCLLVKCTCHIVRHIGDIFESKVGVK